METSRGLEDGLQCRLDSLTLHVIKIHRHFLYKYEGSLSIPISVSFPCNDLDERTVNLSSLSLKLRQGTGAENDRYRFRTSQI